jgi:acetate kinase
MGTLLVVNAGSSSLKFQLFGVDSQNITQLIKGQVDGIGVRPRLQAKADGVTVIDESYEVSRVPDQGAAVRLAGEWLREARDLRPGAVGHRVVHGGPDYDRAIRVDKDILQKLSQLSPLAPLHQPHNLAPIYSLLERFPDLPQIACFDTAFHRSHDALADHYALPKRYYDQGVRRYGFHGLSYEYIAQALRDIDPALARGRIVVAHLGSGASMCALRDGRSVESTMGFTALDGLPMGTRPGQLDPGVLLYLLNQEHMTGERIQHFLYTECGLKGLSGVSNDVRDLEASSDPAASFALDYLAYRVALSAGSLTAALGGIDSFVFTAGVGENSASMRSRIAVRLEWLGLRLDQELNAKGATRISTEASDVKVMVIPTNEELMIARHTLSLLNGAGQL